MVEAQDVNGVVALNLFRNRDTSEKYYRLELRSKMKPGRISRHEIPYTESRLEYAMEVAGGALAEHQNNIYGDDHDPDAVAAASKRALGELKKKIELEGLGV